MHRPVLIPYGLGNRAHISVLDRLAVEAGDGHDAPGRGGHEDLIRAVGCLDGDRLHVDRVAKRAGRVYHALPGDALEDPAVGRVERPRLDEDNVEPRPLCEVGVAVRQEGVCGPAVVRLEQAADEVAPLEVLDRGVNGPGRDPAYRPGHDGGAATVLHARLHDPDIRLDEHVQAVVEQLFGPAPSHARQAAGNDKFHKSVSDPTFGDHIDKRLLDLVARQGHLEPHLLAADVQAVKVVVQSKETPVPNGGNIVGEVAVHKTLVQQRNSGLVQRHQLSLHPSDALSKRVLCLSCFESSLAFGIAGKNLVHGGHGGIVMRVACWGERRGG